MAAKPAIYIKEDQIGHPELLKKLKEAVFELEEKMKAAAPISKGQVRVGWGVSKTHRAIAADAVISVAKAIKSLKGW
jgi:hypothetical protein